MSYFLRTTLATCLALANGLCAAASADSAAPTPTKILKESTMHHITGKFDVNLQPQAPAPGLEAAQLGRQTINKQFFGELDAHSLGEMLAAGTQTKGSAGYVAIERVTGRLLGRSGSFVLMHTGTMNRGQPQLTVQVVPDSGTDGLAGLSGQMGIQITDGQHFYTFDFTLP